MNILRRGVLSIAIVILLLTASSITFAAGSVDEYEPKTGEVIFLLDASGSMNTQDKNRLAIDAIRQAVYSLPSNYRAGLVIYNTEIQAVLALNAGMEQMENQLATVSYAGYTNAGQGLNQAMGLFSETEDIDRYIIMISDGEIDMPEKLQKEASREMYAKSAEWARDRGVKIYIIAAGSELNDPNMHIFDGAELTGGAIYWEGQSGSLTKIMERIINDQLRFPRQAIGVTDASGGNIHVEVPKGAQYLKLQITSESILQNVRADYSADSGQTITGRKFVVVDMTRPVSESVDLYFETQDLSGVQAYLQAEFNVEPQVQADYRSTQLPRTEEEIKRNIPPRYDHLVDVSIGLADTGGKKENLWQQEQYKGLEIPYILNGVSYKGTINDGQIQTTIPADGVESIEVSISTEGMEGIYYINQPIIAEIDKYPDPVFEPTPDYRPLWVVLGCLASAIITLAVWWIKKKNTTVIYVAQPPSSKAPQKKMETRSCTYTGKLNMYVVRTENGRDVPPQTYRLFGRKAGRMTLNQILVSCGIKFQKIGAEDITLYPGPDQSLIIMDQSERCTVLRGTEILKKGMGYPVYYSEKITVSFEDEATEMEIHYKNLKPSEREEI